MRTIKFRGQTAIGKWIYGNYSELNGIHFITPKIGAKIPSSQYEVIPETVGQFTGLLDKNGKEIYEGDKLLIKGNTTAVVVWRNEGFDILDTRSSTPTNKGDIEGFVYVPTKTMEIIGNIHDNPELLTEK